MARVGRVIRRCRLKFKTEKPGLQAAKTGFLVLKKARVTRFFGFGKNRLETLSTRRHVLAI